MGIGVFQPWHLLLILLIVLIVFGAGKLGQVGGALGQSVKEFKSTVNDPEEEQAGEARDPQAGTPVARTDARPRAATPRTAERPVEPLRREEI